MHRNGLLQKLSAYHPADPQETAMHSLIVAFITSHPDCFERTLLEGHITASALIVNKDWTRTLLTHHHKLDKWLQLGGHADGNPDPLVVALTEAKEESGLETIIPVSEEIFDVDVHPIPVRKDVPEHFHYDIRFLLQADDAARLSISAESKDLAWVPLSDIHRYTREESILRMIRKLNAYILRT